MNVPRHSSKIQQSSHDQLASIHHQACQNNASADELLALFCGHPWFRCQLDRSARKVSNQWRLLTGSEDDVRQEALLRFASMLKRNPTLGYFATRGSYAAYLGRLIQRCCQHGGRRLHPKGQRLELVENLVQVDRQSQLDQRLDLNDMLNRVSQPQQSVLRMKLEGWSLEEIASVYEKSKRTISRWLQQGADQIRSHQ